MTEKNPHAVALGSVRSERKARTAAINGRLGGRPPKAGRQEMRMPTYILRHLNPELWARVRERAEREGIPLRALFDALLRLYAEGKVDV